jgi:hypothetical protein
MRITEWRKRHSWVLSLRRKAAKQAARAGVEKSA